MNLIAIVPVRSIAQGKARLARVLDDHARARLNSALLAHTLNLTSEMPGCAATLVVSPDPEVRARAEAAGTVGIVDPGEGLNPAIAAGCAEARERGADRVLVLPIDLPCATPEDIAALAEHASPIAIAPDRAEKGTNALCLAADLAFVPRFGEDSFPAHIVEARRLGVPIAIRSNPRLGLDIDTEADWNEWGRTLDRAAWIDGLAGT